MSKTLELEFRQTLITQLRGLWLPTIHVENHLNPGVPDISYVIPSGNHMTGWLELKAVEVPSEIKIEASQITWIQRHRSYVPCHLLIQIRDVICFVRSSWVGVMNGPRKFEALAESVRFSNDDMRSKLPALLSEATKYH